jgi:hypothetical protein
MSIEEGEEVDVVVVHAVVHAVVRVIVLALASFFVASVEVSVAEVVAAFV